MKHTPRKRFGQNFLTDASVIDAIVRAIRPQPNDLMVEIGPGQGALTHPLLEQLATLHVVELDRDLAAYLTQHFANPGLVVHQADALAFDFHQLTTTPNTLRIIGNLPYNISTPLLFHLCDFANIVHDQHFMLQKEVVERLAATPGHKDFSRLTVMLQARYDITHLFNVPPSAFDPAPRVNSAIVRMQPLPEPSLVKSWPTFSALVTQAFSQRRKILRNSLGRFPDELDLMSTVIDLQQRAEDISVATYIEAANLLAQQRAKTNPASVL